MARRGTKISGPGKPKAHLLWRVLPLLLGLSLACRDDLVAPRALAPTDPLVETPATYAYQLRGDPFLRLLAQQSERSEISLELDRALSVFAPDYVGELATSAVALQTSAATLIPRLTTDSVDVLGEAEIFFSVLGLAVNRVAGILASPAGPEPAVWQSSHSASPLAEP